MNTYENLIMIKGVDKTDNVVFCQYLPQDRKYTVKFDKSNINYFYAYDAVLWLKKPVEVDFHDYRFSVEGKQLYSILKVLKFNEYYRFFFSNGYQLVYHKNQLQAAVSCLTDQKSGNVMEYFRSVAKQISLKTDEGMSLLDKQYEKIEFIDSRSVLAKYLNAGLYGNPDKEPPMLYFPFSCNESQKVAVEKAMSHSVSIIEGPPGTGKTQTILNIIANILLNGQTVAVVSNNKLPELLPEEIAGKLSCIYQFQRELVKKLAIKNELAVLETGLKALKLEEDYFKGYADETFKQELRFY